MKKDTREIYAKYGIDVNKVLKELHYEVVDID